MNGWMEQFCRCVLEAFPGRVEAVGLQGSRGRGEGTAQSDIDVVVILDKLSYEDLQRYDRAISALPQRELICGFVSGREELAHWDAADLFQFLQDTTAVYGALDWLYESVTPEDIRRAVHTGACNLYHMCVHNAVHEKSAEILKGLLKSAAFTLRAKHYLETGVYVRKNVDLLAALRGEDQALARDLLEKDGAAEFDEVSQRLMAWAANLIVRG